MVVETVGLLRNLTRWRTALMRMDMVLAEVVAGKNTVMRQWAVVMHHRRQRRQWGSGYCDN
ncbi:hypothetical protein ACP0HM_12185 [Escherichia coli]